MPGKRAAALQGGVAEGSGHIAGTAQEQSISGGTLNASVDAPLLMLPAPGDGDASITLDASTGEAVTLDHLGPVVVNSDGSLSRISNWEQMSEQEQKITKRRIAKRNVERLRQFEGDEQLKVSALQPQQLLPS